MSRVLVVEDESHLADGLAYNLEAEGHSVQIVADGEAALERLLAKKEKFDAVVLDVMLPGKNGFEVASELRAATLPTLRPAARSCDFASSWLRPTTLGTATMCTPRETTRSTVSPRLSRISAVGSWSMTEPFGTFGS